MTLQLQQLQQKDPSLFNIDRAKGAAQKDISEVMKSLGKDKSYGKIAKEGGLKEFASVGWELAAVKTTISSLKDQYDTAKARGTKITSLHDRASKMKDLFAKLSVAPLPLPQGQISIQDAKPIVVNFLQSLARDLESKDIEGNPLFGSGDAIIGDIVNNTNLVPDLINPANPSSVAANYVLFDPSTADPINAGDAAFQNLIGAMWEINKVVGLGVQADIDNAKAKLTTAISGLSKLASIATMEENKISAELEIAKRTESDLQVKKEEIGGSDSYKDFLTIAQNLQQYGVFQQATMKIMMELVYKNLFTL